MDLNPGQSFYNPVHIPLYYEANLPALNTRQYIAQGLVNPMKAIISRHILPKWLAIPNHLCLNCQT